MSENLVDPLWWILIEQHPEGPYSFIELEKDTRLTPDTLVWKEGMEQWKKVRDLKEFASLFKDKEPEDEEAPQEPPPLPEDEELTLRNDSPLSPNWLAWLLLALLFLFLTYHFIKDNIYS